MSDTNIEESNKHIRILRALTGDPLISNNPEEIPVYEYILCDVPWYVQVHALQFCGRDERPIERAVLLKNFNTGVIEYMRATE